MARSRLAPPTAGRAATSEDFTPTPPAPHPHPPSRRGCWGTERRRSCLCLSSIASPDGAPLRCFAYQELVEGGALASSEPSADITPLGTLMLAMPFGLDICRLLWLGACWGCLADAVVIACGLSVPDPFTLPHRVLLSGKAYREALTQSTVTRYAMDGGYYSEPLQLLRLFVETQSRGAGTMWRGVHVGRMRTFVHQVPRRVKWGPHSTRPPDRLKDLWCWPLSSHPLLVPVVRWFRRGIQGFHGKLDFQLWNGGIQWIPQKRFKGSPRAPFKWREVGGSSPPPPPPGGAEFSGAPKKIVNLNLLAPKAPENFCDRPKARKKTWPNLLRVGGGGGLDGVGGSRGGG